MSDKDFAGFAEINVVIFQITIPSFGILVNRATGLRASGRFLQLAREISSLLEKLLD